MLFPGAKTVYVAVFAAMCGLPPKAESVEMPPAAMELYPASKHSSLMNDKHLAVTPAIAQGAWGEQFIAHVLLIFLENIKNMFPNPLKLETAHLNREAGKLLRDVQSGSDDDF